MSTELPEPIIARLDQIERGQYGGFRQAWVNAIKQHSTDTSSSSAKTVTDAKKLLTDFVAAMGSKYGPAAVAADPGDGERFVNRKQAHNWLQAQGYKVSQGKFYQDCKAGFPALHKDGTLSRYQVMQYGQQLDVTTRADAGGDGPQREDEARKIRAEADIAEMKAEKMRREEDKLWLHADEAWAQVAALVGTLRDAIRHHLYGGQRDLVHVAGGEQDRSQELFEAADQLVARAFNEVAGAEIKIEFEREVE